MTDRSAQAWDAPVPDGPEASGSSLCIAQLRHPDEVMSLARLGSSFPTRLSFMRTLLRRLTREQAVVQRVVWEMDADGFGRAVYSVPLGGRTYSLVAITNPIPEEARTDRVIAEVWDSAYVLYDGVPDRHELDRIATTAPRQEAARFTERDLVLSRANKSVRFFSAVADALADGRQPDANAVREIGYLMRTTAVYGNGKFGIADRGLIAGRDGLEGPFQAEMLTVWLIRGFTLDLVEHVARQQAPETAVALSSENRRRLGIGNSTGLGMAPFLVRHPELIHRWVAARETALARVRGEEIIAADRIPGILALFERVRRHLAEWRTNDTVQAARIATLEDEWDAVCATVDAVWLSEAQPWDRLLGLVASMSLETQELMVALILERNGDLVDDLADEMLAPIDWAPLDARRTVSEMRAAIEAHYSFALACDFTRDDADALFWYVSEEKAEPRIGVRREEPGAERELPLDIARQVAELWHALQDRPENEPLAVLLLERPELRGVSRRVQLTERTPYAEIRDNLIADGMRPIDLLRAKLAFFGASKFDPKSDRWTRITLFQGAPLFEDIAQAECSADCAALDDWWMPVVGGACAG